MKKGQAGRKGATKTNLKPIREIARSIGIRKKYVEECGPFKAKLSLELLRSLKNRKKGKYILVTSITPTPFGEGKTLTGIGISMAFKKLNKKAILSIAQPSLNDTLIGEFLDKLSKERLNQ